jgi:hypothetical protein
MGLKNNHNQTYKLEAGLEPQQLQWTKKRYRIYLETNQNHHPYELKAGITGRQHRWFNVASTD